MRYLHNCTSIAQAVFGEQGLDKDYSHKMELVRRQYSGNAHGIIKGIGIVNCVYVNPGLGRHWIIDYRIFAPDFDGKNKITHPPQLEVGNPRR
jgi:hypothetical protein